jgi:hypothetical protein
MIHDQPFTDDCLAPETVASYLDGRLHESQREPILWHLASCADCRELMVGAFHLVHGASAAPIAEVQPHDKERKQGPRHRWAWPRSLITAGRRGLAAGSCALAAAAGLLLIVSLDPTWLHHQHGEPGSSASRELSPLIAAVGNHRYDVPRLSGGFPWAPPPPVHRGAGTTSPRLLAPAVRLAVADIHHLAETAPTPMHLHALGIAQIIEGHHDDAIDTLLHLASRRPERASLWSDLAAAYLSRLASDGAHTPADQQQAVDAAERAIAADPQLAEAWFNLALACEAAGLAARARDAWEQAAARDHHLAWRTEAASRVTAGDTATSPSSCARRTGRRLPTFLK